MLKSKNLFFQNKCWKHFSKTVSRIRYDMSKTNFISAAFGCCRMTFTDISNYFALFAASEQTWENKIRSNTFKSAKVRYTATAKNN